MFHMARVYLARLFQTSKLARGDVPGLVVTVLAICALLWLAESLGGDPLRRAWALERGAVLEGEFYRLATAHLVHLSRTHSVLNILGLALITVSIWSILTARFVLRATLWAGAAISLGWVLLQPAGLTYVGFSGISHGIYAFGALHLLRRGPVWIGVIVLACMSIKIGYEFAYGPVPGAEAEIGGRVALLAHALGTLGGALGAAGTPKGPRCAVILVALIATLRQIG